MQPRSQGDLRAAILADIGETRTDLAYEPDPLPMTLASGLSADLLPRLNGANGTRHFIKPQATYTDWYNYTTRNRHYKLGAAADATLSASSQKVTGISAWRLGSDTVINQQRATVVPVDFSLSPILVWDYDSLPPLPFSVSGTKTLSLMFADYVDEPILEIRSTGSALSATLTAHGTTADLVLVSAGTSEVTVLNVNGRLVFREPPLSHTANDAASQALARGVRPGPEIRDDFVGVYAMAIGMAEHIIWRYGSPQKRPQVTVENWLTALTLDLYDTISFTSTQLGVTSLIFEIVGITEEVRRAASSTVFHIVTTYILQEQKIHDRFFTWDVDTWDDAVNVLAY